MFGKKSTSKGYSFFEGSSVRPSMPAPSGIRKKVLPLLAILDVSGSMNKNGKITQVNQGFKTALEDIRRLCDEQIVELRVSVMKFSDNAEWVYGPTPVAYDESFVWKDLTTERRTATAKAFKKAVAEYTREILPGRIAKPLVIFMSDGFCTDPSSEYEDAIAQLDSSPLFKNAIRIPIAMGQDGDDYDSEQLMKFSNQELLLCAANASEIVQNIRWASSTGAAASIGMNGGSKSLAEDYKSQSKSIGSSIISSLKGGSVGAIVPDNAIVKQKKFVG